MRSHCYYQNHTSTTSQMEVVQDSYDFDITMEEVEDSYDSVASEVVQDSYDFDVAMEVVKDSYDSVASEVVQEAAAMVKKSDLSKHAEEDEVQSKQTEEDEVQGVHIENSGGAKIFIKPGRKKFAIHL
jgi:hypothetical protein